MAFQKTNFLEPSKIRVSVPPESSRLRVEIEGDRCIPRATVRLAFPLTNPKGYYVLQDGDGKEAGVLRDLKGMEPDSVKAVEAELDRRYFTPKVLAVKGLKQDGGMWRFQVDTQRGYCEFWVRHWRDSSAEIQPGRWQIMSVDGQRFEIPNLDALDTRSLKLLEQLL